MEIKSPEILNQTVCKQEREHFVSSQAQQLKGAKFWQKAVLWAHADSTAQLPSAVPWSLSHWVILHTPPLFFWFCFEFVQEFILAKLTAYTMEQDLKCSQVSPFPKDEFMSTAREFFPAHGCPEIWQPSFILRPSWQCLLLRWLTTPVKPHI